VKKISFVLIGAIALFYLFLSRECYADAYAYVSNNATNTVSVINTSDNTTATIGVGIGPLGVAVDPDGDYVYVANNSDATVSVISTYFNTVAATIDVGNGPLGVAVDPDGEYVYVANNSDATVSVISVSTVTATIGVGIGPLGVAADPDGEYVYVANNSDATVSVIRTSDNTVTATIGVGNGPYGVEVTPNGEYVYVANNSDATVSVISTSDNTVTNIISVGDSPAAFGKFICGTLPEAPTDLVATTVSEKQIDLSWTDNSYDELGFKIERKQYGESFTQINTVSDNVTSYNDTGLSPHRSYYYRVRAYNDAGNSDYSNEASSVTDKEKDGCFIATAVYGSPSEPHVKVLRDFRDRFLLTSSAGNFFVDLYYASSPHIAEFMAKHTILKTMVRWGLLPLVGISWVLLKIGPALYLALMFMLLALMSTTSLVFFCKIKGRKRDQTFF